MRPSRNGIELPMHDFCGGVDADVSGPLMTTIWGISRLMENTLKLVAQNALSIP